MSKLRNPWPVRLICLISRLTASVGPLLAPPVSKVGQQLVPPGVDGAGEAVQLGHVGVGAPGQPAVQMLFGVAAGVGVEESAQVLGGDPCLADLLVDVTEGQQR